MAKDVRTVCVVAESTFDMRRFIAAYVSFYKDSSTVALVDLYWDEEPESGEDVRLLDALRSNALESTADVRSRPMKWLIRRDPLMGVSLDLSDAAQRMSFAVAACFAINSEVWIGDRQILGSVEPGVRIWIDVSDSELSAIINHPRLDMGGLKIDTC